MQAYQTSTATRKPQDLYHWQQHEYSQAYREDCERPGHTASLKTVAYYAYLKNNEGYAVRTPDAHCFFIGNDGMIIELTNADIPSLILLGRINIAETQHLLDNQRGFAAIVTTRHQEM